ncbi:MAG TPA: helix-turn-helix transcriptional regulator [Blastocatellia bacterium]|nr:helix-turn-helix transcriptional regulator [Blastocatellia bacterium]
MGRGKRLQPKNMGLKLKQIRDRLGYSQEQMADRLQQAVPEASIYPGHISQYEGGSREPFLVVLLAYAKIIGVSMDVLVDDEIDLPRKLPSKAKHRP